MTDDCRINATEWGARLGDLKRYQQLDQIARTMDPKLDVSHAFSGAGLDVSRISDATAGCYEALFQSDPANKRDDFSKAGKVFKDFIDQANIDSDKVHLSLAEVMKKLNLGSDPQKLDKKQQELLAQTLANLAFYTAISSTMATQEPPMGQGGAITALGDKDIPASLFSEPEKKAEGAQGAEGEDLESASPEQVKAFLAAREKESKRTMVMFGLGALVVGAVVFFLGKSRGRIEGRLEGEAMPPAETFGFGRRLLGRFSPELAYRGMFKRAVRGVDLKTVHADAVLKTLDPPKADATTPDPVRDVISRDVATAQARAKYLEGLKSGDIKLPVIQGARDIISGLFWVGTLIYVVRNPGEIWNLTKKVFASVLGGQKASPPDGSTRPAGPSSRRPTGASK